jgi:hypothetical protein
LHQPTLLQPTIGLAGHSIEREQAGHLAAQTHGHPPPPCLEKTVQDGRHAPPALEQVAEWKLGTWLER